MNNYDFLNLSPIDFELLTRDLLEQQLNVQLEAFGPWMDRGIDLRCSRGKDIVVQCKRYASYSKLKHSLKSEVAKVRLLKPQQYVVTTSVSLSPDRKDEILQMFSPYLLDTGDIYGKEDLNGLLVKHPVIERNHFKLWLSSTNVLQSIIHSQLYNQSKILLEEIRDKIKFYVPNKSYQKAMSILKESKYVIISGIPGIGKTTLAEMLVYNLLANGYDEFINLSGSIDGGFALLEEQRKQVFLFDDFLGSNFLEDAMNLNEDKQILRFIAKIQKSKNALLIFTTREYILNQATAKFESFEREEFVKCILDLSKYTALEKAKILYNHLYFNEISPEYSAQLMLGRNLLTIVNHKNYSPRIVEYVAKKKTWQNCEPKKFPEMLIGVLDAPEKVWLHAFQNHISDLARVILFSMLTMGDHCHYTILYDQVKEFSRCFGSEYELKINSLTFNRALKELDNSFIHLNRKSGEIIVKFHNPSIQDFLVHYLNTHPELKLQTALSALHLKELLTIFGVGVDHSYSFGKHLSVTPGFQRAIVSRLIADFERLRYSTEDNSFLSLQNDDNTALKLFLIHRHMRSDGDELNDFMADKISGILYSLTISNKSVAAFCELIAAYFTESDGLDLKRIILNVSASFWDFMDIRGLSNLQETFPNQFKAFAESEPDVYEAIFEDTVSALGSVDSDNIEELRDNLRELEDISDCYGIDTEYHREEIRFRVQELEELSREDDLEYETDYGHYESDFDPADPFSSYSFSKDRSESSYLPPASSSSSEEDQINDMFNTL